MTRWTKNIGFFLNYRAFFHHLGEGKSVTFSKQSRFSCPSSFSYVVCSSRSKVHHRFQGNTVSRHKNFIKTPQIPGINSLQIYSILIQQHSLQRKGVDLQAISIFLFFFAHISYPFIFQTKRSICFKAISLFQVVCSDIIKTNAC